MPGIPLYLYPMAVLYPASAGVDEIAAPCRHNRFGQRLNPCHDSGTALSQHVYPSARGYALLIAFVFPLFQNLSTSRSE